MFCFVAKSDNRKLWTVGLLCCAAITCFADRLQACPFCNAASQTLSEELASAEASVIATLEKPVAGSATDDPSAETPSEGFSEAVFRIKKVLKGSGLKEGDTIQVVYFGSETEDKAFLINALLTDKLDWATPLPLSSRGEEYIAELLSLPSSGEERLEFFMGYLEDADPLLAQDAYDEFARAPYAELIALEPKMNHEQLVSWINDAEVGPTRRRLYLTMLGVCGTAADIEMLESLLQYDYESMRPGIESLLRLVGAGGVQMGASLVDELAQADVRAKQQCLDALIAAYLKLKGPEGLALINERFLANPKADYTQQYSAIMALRFHGEESKEIPREDLVKSLRLLLDNSEIADQVIPDLTRWEDWEVMDRLVGMFKDSEEDGWIRQPVISYLLIAADQLGEVGDKANAAVAEVEQIDPAGVKRARSYLSFGLMTRGSTPSASTQAAATLTETDSAADSNSTAAKEETGASEVAETPSQEVQTQPNTKSLAANQQVTPPRTSMIITVSVLAGAVLMGLFGLMLKGGHVSQ